MAENYDNNHIGSRPFFKIITMWVVYNLYTYQILFTGSPDSCVTFIECYPGNWANPIDVAPKDYVVNQAFTLILNNHAN